MNWKDDMMAEFDQEMGHTRKELERLPEGKEEWQPHPKSMTVGRLANHLANLPSWGVMTVKESSFDVAPIGGSAYVEDVAPDRTALLATFDRNVAEARSALSDLTEADMDAPWSLMAGGQTMFTMPRRAVLRSMIFNHNVHHRAQLGVYLRMNGVPLPSIYGPTADEQ